MFTITAQTVVDGSAMIYKAEAHVANWTSVLEASLLYVQKSNTAFLKGDLEDAVITGFEFRITKDGEGTTLIRFIDYRNSEQRFGQYWIGA